MFCIYTFSPSTYFDKIFKLKKIHNNILKMKYETIDFEYRDHVAFITLNREDNANAMNLKMAEELMEASIRCDTESEIRAVLITGRGKFFCAGGDLKSFFKAGNQAGILAKQITTSLHAAISRFARMAPPLVVAVNGTVAGGGLSLVLVADMVLSNPSAKFTLAYTRAGLVPDGSSTYFLPRLIGMRRARELIFTNRVLNAQEAVDWHLINRVCKEDQLQIEAEKLVKTLSEGPLQSHRIIKQLLLESFSSELETQMESESRGLVNALLGKEGQEGICAFKDKRRPVFFRK
jgi:2-(1,2-epoxy-1,2-dihydrophenyl)acetyl-CoA isomerase